MENRLTGITRRKFLLSGTLVTGSLTSLAVSLLHRGSGSRVSTIPVAAIKQDLRGLFSDLDAARVLGRRYINLYPQDAQYILLFDKLVSSRQPGFSRKLKAIIARERESDFQNNRIVIIDGWLLARTEAEVCALTVLL